MQLLIDDGMLNQYDKAVNLYIQDSVKTDTSKGAVVSLLNALSSRMNDINLLIKNHSYDSAKALMRVAFENQVYIDYIMSIPSRRKNRGKAYFYSDFQKLSYYLAFMDQTTIATSESLIRDINTSNNASILGHFSSVNDYLNHFREEFRSCFVFTGNENKRGLRFRAFTDDEPFQRCKIDSWKWYNDDGKTSDFRSLVLKLDIADEYMALYAPTSDSIHSDGLRRNLDIKPKEVAFVESFNPSFLACFRLSILKDIKILAKATHSLEKQQKIIQCYRKAEQINAFNRLHEKH